MTIIIILVRISKKVVTPIEYQVTNLKIKIKEWLDEGIS